jgi:hypothetical protein
VPVGILDVIAEDPEIAHVAVDVQPAGVQDIDASIVTQNGPTSGGGMS